MPDFFDERFVSQSAELHAVLFENSHVGVPLGVYWSIEIIFERTFVAGALCEPRLSADWIRLPSIRDWRQLSGVHVRGGPDVLDASVCTHEHDPVLESSLRVGDRARNEFAIDWEGTIDTRGWEEPAVGTTAHLRATTRATFVGVIIPDELAASVGGSTSEINRLAGQFIDLATLGPVRRTPNKLGHMWNLFPPASSELRVS